MSSNVYRFNKMAPSKKGGQIVQYIGNKAPVAKHIRAYKSRFSERKRRPKRAGGGLGAIFNIGAKVGKVAAQAGKYGKHAVSAGKMITQGSVRSVGALAVKKAALRTSLMAAKTAKQAAKPSLFSKVVKVGSAVGGVASTAAAATLAGLQVQQGLQQSQLSKMAIDEANLQKQMYDGSNNAIPYGNSQSDGVEHFQGGGIQMPHVTGYRNQIRSQGKYGERHLNGPHRHQGQIHKKMNYRPNGTIAYSQTSQL